jgi:hypothetical protein
MDKHFEEAIILEKNNRKYALLPLCIFHDMPTRDRHSDITKQFGIVDIYETKSVYEIIDESKFMLAKIKYNV